MAAELTTSLDCNDAGGMIRQSSRFARLASATAATYPRDGASVGAKPPSRTLPASTMIVAEITRLNCAMSSRPSLLCAFRAIASTSAFTM
jgi:hypothetical protein